MNKRPILRLITLLLFVLAQLTYAQEAQEETETTTEAAAPAKGTESIYGLTAFGHYGLSLGEYKDQVSDYNLGGSLHVDTRFTGIPFELYTEVGFASYNPAVTTLTSLSGLNFGIGGGYPFALANNLALIPAFYFGGNLYFSEGIYGGSTQSKTVLDSYQKFSLHLAYTFDQTSSLYVTPYFMLIPEDVVSALIPGIALGYRYQL